MAVCQSTQVKVDLRWLKAPGRFVLHFVEMWIAMLAGMLVFMAVPGVIALPSLLHQVGMAVAMTVPMVGWMRIRGHSWRHGIEMSIGMLAPWAAVLILVGLGADQVFPWLAKADGAAMLLGMLAVMLLRPHHYAHQHACHAEAPASGSIDPVCGMAIDPASARHAANHDGQTYAFCAPGCRKAFLAEPARYLSPAYTPSM
jgi:YHS domain-containing protein